MQMSASVAIAMSARGRKPTRSFLAIMSALIFFVAVRASAANASGSDNLPVYTSPIDITGLKLQLQAVAPDRDTGKPVVISFPAGLVGPRMNGLLSTPLSMLMDQYWNVNRSVPYLKGPLKASITPRENACIGQDGIIQRVQQEVRKIGSSYSAYDVSCNLTSSGTLVAKLVDPYLYLSYVLTHNSVSFTLTTPYTCHAHHGTLACPDDPRLTIQFVTVITTPVRTADICHITAGAGVVSVQDVNIDGSSSLTGSLAQLGDDLFLGHKFSVAERSIENAIVVQPLPLDSYLKELRDSDACTGRNLVLHRALVPFRLNTLIQPPQGVILQAMHVGITAPTVDAPDPWSSSKPSQPTFTHPMISANQPLVVAGSSLQISGQYFPANNVSGLANQLPLSVSHGGYGANSIILGGVCWGGSTEFRWSVMGSPFGAGRVEQVPGDPNGVCARNHEANNLIPATTYDFRARDCDQFTCSPWSVPLRRMTAAAGSSKGPGDDRGTVTLIIDRNAECKAPWCGPAVNTRVAQQPGNAGASPSNGIPTSGECNTPLCRVGMSSSAVKVASNPLPSSCDTPLCRGAHSSAASVAANATNGGSNAPWSRPPEKSAHISQTPIPVGFATLTPQGTFVTTVTVPSSVAPGNHSIWASNGDAEAEVAINVTAPYSSGRASLMVIAIVAAGESGCPNRPSSSLMGDTNFMLFGAGFTPGSVSVYADRATGTRPLGTATVHSDGTFCEQMRGISGRELGPHTLLAIENGAVQAQAAITVVPPTHTGVN